MQTALIFHASIASEHFRHVLTSFKPETGRTLPSLGIQCVGHSAKYYFIILSLH